MFKQHIVNTQKDVQVYKDFGFDSELILESNAEINKEKNQYFKKSLETNKKIIEIKNDKLNLKPIKETNNNLVNKKNNLKTKIINLLKLTN